VPPILDVPPRIFGLLIGSFLPALPAFCPSHLKSCNLVAHLLLLVLLNPGTPLEHKRYSEDFSASRFRDLSPALLDLLFW